MVDSEDGNDRNLAYATVTRAANSTGKSAESAYKPLFRLYATRWRGMVTGLNTRSPLLFTIPQMR